MFYKTKIANFGENLAEKYLKDRNYQILARNKRVGKQEIDILAKIKDKYVVIEVKTRTSEKAGKAIEAVNKRKYNNLIKAMGSLALLHDISPENIELDIIAIDLKKDEKSAKIKHYRSII